MARKLGKASGWLLRQASGGRAAVVFIFTLLVMAGINMLNAPYTVPRFRELAGGTGMIDLAFNYTPGQVYGMLASYGEAGRAYYLRMLAVVDIPFPLLYGTALSLMLSYLMRQYPRVSGSRLRILNLVPFGATAADYLENAAIFILLVGFPHRLDAVAYAANIMTLLKSGLSAVSLLLLTGFFAAGFRRKARV